MERTRRMKGDINNIITNLAETLAVLTANSNQKMVGADDENETDQQAELGGNMSLALSGATFLLNVSRSGPASLLMTRMSER